MRSVFVTVATLYFAALAAAQQQPPAPTATGTVPSATRTGTAGPAPTGGAGGGNNTGGGGAGALRLPTLQKVDPTDSMPKAKVCNPDKSFCVTVTDLGNSIDVMAEGPKEAKWIGVGWGTGMPQADMVLGYMLPNRTFMVSDRKATNGRAPAPVDPQQDAIPIRGGAAVVDGKWVSQFQRPKRTGDANDVDLTNLDQDINMIWAIHETTPAVVPTNGTNPEYRATITKHTKVGRLTLKMKDPAQVEAAKQGAGGAQTPPATGGNQAAAPSSASTVIVSLASVALSCMFVAVSAVM